MKVCVAEGCDRKQNARGLCPKHYYRNKTYGDPNKVRYPWREDRSCSVPDCPEEHEAKGFCRKHYMVIKKFGIDPQEYINKIVNQQGSCAICKQECSHGKMLALDHDHETGKFRDLLCASCNLSLGGFRDDPEILMSALRYLEKWGKLNV